ncbi:hypothetical protein FOCC_FOCC007005 [Frankliniella occidentalis]|nr:hypothetical protein FOCC_FOCC007687 [Frankliniella occidentalis]KAE8746333.1 hypothetical protein FOCC_FOCC007005 [Frankliniella occidentalis]
MKCFFVFLSTPVVIINCTILYLFITGSPSSILDVDNPDWAPTLKLSHFVPVTLQLNQEEILVNREEVLVNQDEILVNREENLVNHVQVVKESQVGSTRNECEADPRPQSPGWVTHYKVSLSYSQMMEVCDELKIEVPAGDHPSVLNFSESSQDLFHPDGDSETEDEVFFDAEDVEVGLGLSIGTQTVKNWKDRATQTKPQLKGRATQTDIKKYRTIATQTELSMDDIEKTENLLDDAQCKINALSINQDWYKDDDVTQYYTGLPTYGVLMAIFEVVAPYLTYTSRSTLTKFQQFALTLMKLKLNLYLTDLGYRFNVSKYTAGRIFTKCIEVMYCRLKRNVFWPERPLLQASMPDCFKESFGDSVTVIVDCFEIFCEKSSNLMAKSQTWSNYKGHETVKYLIAVTPQGFICFVSQSYGGRSSDKFITEDSGFLRFLTPGDTVMADRGFLVEDSISLHKATLVMPGFLRGLSQLSPDDVDTTRIIANVRVHVERVIGMLRQKYRIMSNRVPVRLLNYEETDVGMDEIAVVCCALTNFSPGIVD